MHIVCILSIITVGTQLLRSRLRGPHLILAHPTGHSIKLLLHILRQVFVARLKKAHNSCACMVEHVLARQVKHLIYKLQVGYCTHLAVR